MKNIIIIFLLFLSCNCYSQEEHPYLYVTSSKHKTKEYYYKIEKHYEIGNSTTMWFKTLSIPKPHKNKKGKIIYPPAEYTLSYLTIYCDNKTYSHEEYATYNLQDELLKSGNLEIYQTKIFPDTILELISNQVCD